MTVLGAGLLWFGWFGFNAGSAVAANGLAASAFLVTNTAAAAATLTWVGASYLHKRKVSVVGAACGAVAGLVAITPASGFVTPGGAILIGLVAGGLCYSATLLRERIKVDDALDVFAVHGVGGTFGAVATGVLATSADPGELQPGLIDGNAGQVVTQLRRGRRDDRLRRRRHVRHRQARRRHPRTPDLCPGRGARHRSLHARRGRLPGIATVRDSRPDPSRSDRPGHPPGRSLRLHGAADASTPTPTGRSPLRPAVRARCVRDRVRGGRGRPESRPGAAARAGRPRGARSPRRVRGRRRVERRGGRRAAAGGVGPRRHRSRRGRSARPASPSCSCPAAAAGAARARAIVAEAFAGEGLSIATWRRVPMDPGALGAAAAATRPDVVHAIIDRPVDAASGRPISDSDFERRLVIARRRLETAARAARLDDLSVPSASCRTIVYKGLVAGGRLAELYPDLARPIRGLLRALPPALRDEHPADLAARPAIPLDRPQRRDRHGPGQPRAGPRQGRRRDRRRRRRRDGHRPGRGPTARRGGPAPLAGRLRLAVARRDAGAARRDRLGPGIGAARGAAGGLVAPPRAAPPRCDAPPRDRRAARSVGRPGGDRLLRRPPGRGDHGPQRPATGGLRRDPGPARCRRVGSRSDSPRAAGHGPPRAAGPGGDAPRRPAAARGPRGRRREGAPPSPAADPRRAAPGPRRCGARGHATARRRRSAISRASTPRRPASTSRRWSSTATSRSGAWATTRRRRGSPGSIGRSRIISASRSPR